MKWLARLFINAVVIFLMAYLTSGWLVHVEGFWGALLAALILALVNAFIRPFVMLISLPANLVTLGLFTFVINALMLMLVSVMLSPTFEVMDFWRALIASLVISVVSSFASRHVSDEGQ